MPVSCDTGIFYFLRGEKNTVSNGEEAGHILRFVIRDGLRRKFSLAKSGFDML